MENVEGLVSSENGRYFQRLYASMEDSGYVVAHRVQDAVSFGVPQFRSRLWVWGIRRDLYAAGMRHAFPKPTHAWPWPMDAELFGGTNLLPAITVGWALNIPHRQKDGEWFAGNETMNGLGAIRKPRSKNVIRRDHPVDEPCPTIEARAALGGGSCLKVIGGGYNPPAGCADLRTTRDITDEPATTIQTGSGNALPEIRYDHGIADLTAPCPTLKTGGNYDADGKQGGGSPPAMAYRWSDAMLQKHSPASTILGKFYKGGAEGLLRIDGANGWSGQRILEPGQPGPTIPGGTNQEMLAIPETLQLPAATISAGSHSGGPEPINNRIRAGYVRRLTPLECLRLQSGPDDFRWPEKISKTNQYKIVGNGVACGHGHAFAQAFASVDPEAITVISLFCGGGLLDCGWHRRFWSFERTTE